MSKQRIENLIHTFKVCRSDAAKVDKLLTIIRAEKSESVLQNCMKQISDIIDGYGVEEITTPDYDLVATYVNKGETYTNTVLVTANYYPLICCWGDYVDGKRTL